MSRTNQGDAPAALTGGRVQYLTLAQAAERISTPAESIRYWIYAGKLRAFKPGRQVLVRDTDLDALIEASAVDVLRATRARASRRASAR